MRETRVYQLRQEILKGLNGRGPAPTEFDDIFHFGQIPFLKPTRQELLEQWNAMLSHGYMTPLKDSGGEYVVISAKGQDQINREGDMDSFIWGKFGLKTLCAVLAAGLIALCAGCRGNDLVHREYYESGQLKSEFIDKSSGFPEWSDGAGKTIDLLDVNVSGIGK